ncbi:FAD-binding oxidoreductase [Clostridium sp. Marseille-Q2269]|uniref:FAD-binding oxidoreductase n=1 Tax=Clostridium sp. Marseille-Q2269 TaxID=2942205 RepID=UPI002073C69A|nr:FAD-binding oxidoreductase [Clostridium sp. Marseille-Q2269]
MTNNKAKLHNTWTGFKDCIVFNKIKEDEAVISLYLRSLDGSKLPEFIAGQFIAIRIKNKDNTFTKPRQYTLSMKSNGEFYRISVKKQGKGSLSERLCNDVKVGGTIQITAPIGKFILKHGKKPLVLIGGGIGITPMLTMANEAINTGRKIHFIYSVPNSKNHSFKEEIEKLCENDNFKSNTFYTRPCENDELKENFYIEDRMTKKWMIDNLSKDGEFYFCGPTPFMKDIYHNLISMGTEKQYINFEMFEAGEDITKK